MPIVNWEMGSKPFKDGTRDVTLNFLNNNETGAVSGQLWFKGMLYSVNGAWAASGSVPGRNYSAFVLWGADSIAADYVAATATFKGPGNAPVSIFLNLNRVETGDGQQYGWDGELKPIGYDWGVIK